MKWILGQKYFAAKMVKFIDIVIHPIAKKRTKMDPCRMGLKTYKLIQNLNTSSETFETWHVCSQEVAVPSRKTCV